MTAMIAQPGDLGIDYSGARPSPKGTRAAGGRFILRYSAGAGNTEPSTQWKLCGLHEIRDAVAAGLDFIANSEWYTNRVTQGAAKGHADGQADAKFWASRGYAPGATIYVSWDADPVRGLWASADAYFRAYGAACKPYKVGTYAGTPYLRHALAAKIITHGWRPNAGSWSNDGLPWAPATGTRGERALLLARALKATPASIYQTGGSWWKGGADENLLLRPAGSHLEALAAAAPPKPKPVVTPPKVTPPHPAPKGTYSNGGNAFAHALGSSDGSHALGVTNDGRLAIYADHKVVSYVKGDPA